MAETDASLHRYYGEYPCIVIKDAGTVDSRGKEPEALLVPGAGSVPFVEQVA